MGYKFNPFTGSLDTVDSPNGVFNEIDISGDITLDDGGTYETTVQVVTPTANRTISFPDATGTVALVAGSSGQLTYNNAGAQAGDANLTWNGTTGLALGKPLNVNIAGAASTPSVSFLGSWYTGGTSTTTKPKLLIEPTGTTSTAWSTDGTGLGVNAASGFAGNLLDLQTNGTSRVIVQAGGNIGLGGAPVTSDYSLYIKRTTGTTPRVAIESTVANSYPTFQLINDARSYNFQIDGATDAWRVYDNTASAERLRISTTGNVGIASNNPGDKLEIGGAGAGIILASPDGTRYRLTVANGGTLSIAAV